jgi:hypothetical protein
LLPTTEITNAGYLRGLRSTETTESPEREELFWVGSSMVNSNRGDRYAELVIGDSGDIGVVVPTLGPENREGSSAQIIDRSSEGGCSR